jgi:hypothetical protein
MMHLGLTSSSISIVLHTSSVNQYFPLYQPTTGADPPTTMSSDIFLHLDLRLSRSRLFLTFPKLFLLPVTTSLLCPIFTPPPPPPPPLALPTSPTNSNISSPAQLGIPLRQSSAPQTLSPPSTQNCTSDQPPTCSQPTTVLSWPLEPSSPCPKSTFSLPPRQPLTLPIYTESRM